MSSSSSSSSPTLSLSLEHRVKVNKMPCNCFLLDSVLFFTVARPPMALLMPRISIRRGHTVVLCQFQMNRAVPLFHCGVKMLYFSATTEKVVITELFALVWLVGCTNNDCQRWAGASWSHLCQLEFKVDRPSSNLNATPCDQHSINHVSGSIQI